MNNQPPPHHSRFATLDGLRGVAAICVMFHHYAGGQSYDIARNTNLAVDLFFILSGFVIVHSYGDRLRTGVMSAVAYVSKRFIRLYPMYLAGLLAGFYAFYYEQQVGMYHCPPSFVTKSFILNFFYLPAFNDYMLQYTPDGDIGRSGILFPSNPPAWSLFFEVVASLAFLLLVRLNLRNLVLTVALSFAALIGYGLYSAHSDHRWAVDLEMGWTTKDFIGGFPRVIFGFSYGVLIHALIHDERVNAVRLWFGRFIKSSFLLYLLLILIFMFPKLLNGLYPAFAIAIAAPFLVFAGSNVTCSSRLELNIANFLGWISYPVYCLHLPVGNLVGLALRKTSYSAEFAIVVSIAITFTASVLLTRFYEEPVRAYLSRKLSSRSGPSGRK